MLGMCSPSPKSTHCVDLAKAFDCVESYFDLLIYIEV